MANYYYKKSTGDKLRKYLRFMSILLFIIGVSSVSYVLFPLVSWQVYFSPAFASQHITSPVPSANIVELAKNSINTTDFYKAENWFPKFNKVSGQNMQTDTPLYTISIPKINIQDAVVSTIDTDLVKHLVNYPGTSIPGKNGNAVIFGHSTLPQLFNTKDYKTIFANAYKLKNGDNIYAMFNNVIYSYKIFKTVVVDPEDTSFLMQDYDSSYLTLVTCTPPGTVWKRLVVKARLETI